MSIHLSFCVNEHERKKTVRQTVDLHQPPVVTDEQKTRLAALKAMPDDRTDYGDALADTIRATSDKLPEP
ncbi:hypothetical protein [Erwinia amylovora]|uniref:hypothetical protein n=1 Tax=Erwinia amylovora TaxID=552 RepID=UPI001F0426AC|nr:hypothetical protein [Erwinia amylovora]